ncbi:MAG: transaldolase [Thioalkalispiraceae bacterium]|jgi:transaldolase
MSKLTKLQHLYGQSIWLDYIDRNLLLRGGLQALVEEGIRGVTSNPTIFNQAITQSTDYDDTIRDFLQADHEIDDQTLYEWLTIQDVQLAADILEPVYRESGGSDGFVSLEVSPYLAFESNVTIKAARHLWRSVDRPNLMIKVPATEPGLTAIEQLIAEGINVNATLLFSVERYKKVLEAYLSGLAKNPEPGKVASVASFFLSRIDTKVDAQLDEIGTPEALRLKGKTAIASAKLAYQHFKKECNSAAVKTKLDKGARIQRLLWASTGTKNPEYSDVLYVEELIGGNTVNTLTPATLDNFQAHGELHASLEEQQDAANQQLVSLSKLGIDLNVLTTQLEREGVWKFTDSYVDLLNELGNKRYNVARRYAG